MDDNDRIQQAGNEERCSGIAEALTLERLRAVCDLNYLDDTGPKSTLVTRIVNDRWNPA